MNKIIKKYLDYCCEIECWLELNKDMSEEGRSSLFISFRDTLSEKEIKDIMSLRENDLIERLKDSLEEEERLLYEIYKEITD